MGVGGYCCDFDFVGVLYGVCKNLHLFLLSL